MTEAEKTEMITAALNVLKDRIGIKSNVRNDYLEKILISAYEEMEEEKGLTMKKDSLRQLMFMVDLSDWRYTNRGSMQGMPRHLQFRLHNLMISDGGDPNAEE